MRLYKLTPAREKVLYTIFLFRCIPMIYISKGLTAFTNLKGYYNVYNLAKTGHIIPITDVSLRTYLYLTEKGYRYVQEKILEGREPQYRYMRARDRRLSISPHMFYNLRFVWNFIDKNFGLLKKKDIRIYTDTDVNNCKLRFNYQGYNLEIRPDVLIKIRSKDGKQNEKLIIVENDTGSENTIQIYRKFIRYGFYLDKTGILHSSGKGIYYPDVEHYFICESGKRLQNLFEGGNLGKYFRKVNSYKNRFNIKTETLLEVFSGDYFRFYIANWEKYKPKKFDLRTTVRMNSLFRDL